jgi:hydroxymethylglutaryl-CoA lyase
MTLPAPSLPERVRVVEVGPRDGLQNERVHLSIDQKLQLVQGLVDAGLRDIEVGSFVHPRWIPQMADTPALVRRLPRRDDVRYWVLVPNERGLDSAIEAGATHVAVFVSSSESHNRRNLNRTISESLEGLAKVLAQAVHAGLAVRGYISTVFGCPYEGDVDFDRVLDIAAALLGQGVLQVSFGDTTGMGTPAQVGFGMARAVDAFGTARVALHLHDTRGTGVANAMMGLQAGVTTFDTSVGGMGGCPYAPGAAGNLGTEDLLYLLSSLGVDHGVDREQLLAVSRRLESEWGATLNSAFWRWARSTR